MHFNLRALGSVLAGLLLCAGSLARATETLIVPPQAVTFQLGELSIVSLHDGNGIAPNDATAVGIDGGVEGVHALMKAAGAPVDQRTSSYSVLLVKLGPRTILIDTGEGTIVGGVLLQSLAAAKVAASDITDILITHSHYDHVGGLVDKDGRSEFPSAKIHISAPEWAYFQSGPRPSKRTFQGRDYVLDSKTVVDPIKGQVTTFAPGDEIFPGLKSVPIPGHTPGHVGYEISSRGQRLMVVGDLLHNHIISLAKPLWTNAFDFDPKLGAQTRLAMVTQLAASGELVFSGHLPFPSIGRIKATDEGFVWAPVKP